MIQLLGFLKSMLPLLLDHLVFFAGFLGQNDICLFLPRNLLESSRQFTYVSGLCNICFFLDHIHDRLRLVLLWGVEIDPSVFCFLLILDIISGAREFDQIIIDIDKTIGLDSSLYDLLLLSCYL